MRYLNKEYPIASNGRVDGGGVRVADWFGYEDNRYWKEIKVLSTVADTGVGNALTFQLDPTYVSNGAYFGREGDIVTMKGTGVQARIQSISGTTPNFFFTLLPQNVNQSIGGVTAGELIAITSGSKAPGSDQHVGAISGQSKREFWLQIIDENFDIEGSSITAQTYFDVYSQDGKLVPYAQVDAGTFQAQYRYDRKWDGAFLLGEVTTNPNITEVNSAGVANPVSTTKGIIPTITDLGPTMNVAPNAFAVDDFQDIAYMMLQEGVSSDVALFSSGTRRLNEINNLFKTYLENATDFSMTVQNTFGTDTNGAKAMGAFLNMKEINIANVSFLLDRVDAWSDPTSYDLSGYDYTWQAIAMPITKFRDAKSGAITDNIAVRYVENHGYNRRFEIWTTGGAGGAQTQYNSTWDEKKIHMRGEMGLQFFLANQCTHVNT
jgi:hypothetical protein